MTSDSGRSAPSGTRRRFPDLGAAAFVLGLTLLGFMAFLSAWPDMEASVFDSATAAMADEPLDGLRCPLAITAGEAASIRVAFHNDRDRASSFLVRSRISRGFVTLVHEETEQVRLEPGGSTELSWPINAADATYGRMVLARVLAMRGGGQPARERACGVLVLGDSALKGWQLFALGVLAGVLGVVAGGRQWYVRRRPLSGRHRSLAGAAMVLVAIVVASLAVGIIGAWLASHLLLVLAVLFLVALLYHVSAA